MIKMRGVALLLAFALAANTVSAGIVIEKASREVRAFSASICLLPVGLFLADQALRCCGAVDSEGAEAHPPDQPEGQE